MHVYVGKTFTATVSGSVMKEVFCAKCRCLFFYQLARTATGTGEAPYYIGQDAAQQRAQHRANARLAKMLQRDSEVVPCPKCDHIQPNMLRDVRRRMYRILRWLAIVPLLPLLIFGIFALVEYSSHPYRFERDHDGYLIAAAVCITLIILPLLLRYFLTQRITAKGNEHLLATAVQGAPPALLPQQGVPDASGNVPLKIAPRSKVFAGANTGDWITFPLLRIALPQVCCVCLNPATTTYRSPMGTESNIKMPICSPCAQQVKSLAWKRIGLLSLACISAAALISLIPDHMDLGGRIIMALCIACFSIVIIAVFVPQVLGKPFRSKTLDVQRGIVRLRFRNQNYTLLLRGLVDTLEGGADHIPSKSA